MFWAPTAALNSTHFGASASPSSTSCHGTALSGAERTKMMRAVHMCIYKYTDTSLYIYIYVMIYIYIYLSIYQSISTYTHIQMCMRSYPPLRLGWCRSSPQSCQRSVGLFLGPGPSAGPAQTFAGAWARYGKPTQTDTFDDDDDDIDIYTCTDMYGFLYRYIYIYTASSNT